MLDRLEAERSTSNAQALAAQEAERHRIAQELHDEVGQSLTVVLLGLKQLEQRAPGRPGATSSSCCGRARGPGSTTYAGWPAELRPGVLDDLGLRQRAGRAATDFAAARRTPRCAARSPPGCPTLAAEAELVVYRVAQEALTNAARHAGASDGRAVADPARRRTSCWRSPTTAAASAGRPERAGLRGMRERALLVGRRR